MHACIKHIAKRRVLDTHPLCAAPNKISLTIEINQLKAGKVERTSFVDEKDREREMIDTHAIVMKQKPKIKKYTKNIIHFILQITDIKTTELDNC